MSSELDTRHAQSFRCNGCGGIIGVYEPLVVVDHADVRHTSRAAEPGLGRAIGEYYHRDCYPAQHSLA